ncbi:membrane protein-like protein [Methanococcus maripaludis C5]|uniref:Membrane protein-like protein n=1 Tax=Methanococcus maripaludis (strain C5 / ATCC BAA-1333) TaxID=402880 RepID=A4FZH3_METM5|nr:DUF2206 domain-containing protein [Methanococcus maripaludis]ABO35607.1 membrane protein-like protein [Methanococcus maripaludis C5]
MKILNPFKLQNWEYKKFLILIMGLQISFLGILGLNSLGTETSIVRPLLGFIYLAFIPGYILLRIFQMQNIESFKSIIYATGLSIFFDMLIGLLINILYPIYGITNVPFSEFSVLLSIFLFTNILLCLSSLISRFAPEKPPYLEIYDLRIPLLCSILPIISYIGSYLSNYFENNLLLLLLIIGILAIISKLSLLKNIKNGNEILLFSIALSLLMMTSLSGGEYIRIYDGEGIVPNVVIEKELFDFDHNNNCYSVLGNGILTPMLINFLSVDIVVIYKYFFIFLLSLIPVSIYYMIKSLEIFKNSREIFFSAFLFMTLSPFLNTMPFLKKQGLAMFFLALFFLTFFENKILIKNKIILTCIFLISIIWSHYGVAALTLGIILISTLPILIIGLIYKDNNPKLLLKLLIIYLVIFFTWYPNVSQGSLIKSLFDISSGIYLTITESLNIENSRGYTTLTTFSSPLYALFKLLNISILLLTFVGYFWALFDFIKETSKKFNKKFLQYLVFSSNYLFILMATMIPGFAIMNVSRLTAMAYILLAPYLIYLSTKISNIKIFKNRPHIGKNIFFTILSINLLISSGFIGEIVKQEPLQVSLSKETIKNSNSISTLGKYYYSITHPQDVFGTKWIAKHRTKGNDIHLTLGFLDTLGVFQPYANIEWNSLTPIKKGNYIDLDGYLFLYSANTKSNVGVDRDIYGNTVIWYNSSGLKDVVMENNKIYDNSGSQIYLN